MRRKLFPHDPMIRFTLIGLLSSGDVFVTIRSVVLSSVIDGLCPKSTPMCDNLHANHLGESDVSPSQEWTLVSLTSGQSMPSLTAGSSTPSTGHFRRPILLQNVLTNAYASRAANQDGPNVSLSTFVLPTSMWTFVYASVKEQSQDCFAIATSSAEPSTIDHYGKMLVNVRTSFV